jgi:drug/metabolite transporter (DMT)-like permease
MRSIPYGELAALGTAACWTTSSLAFTAAGRRIGSLSLNLIRLVLGFFFLVAFCALTRGLPLPTDATREAWAWLSLSGAVGFVIGDLCLFRAFVVIGPRISTLIMSLVPPIAATLGWLWLGERLGPMDLAGMALTLAGIIWVVLERAPRVAALPGVAAAVQPGHTGGMSHARGIALAVLGAVGQAVGLVLSKLGMGDYDPFAATQIRIIAGIAGFSLVFFAVRWWGRVFESVRHKAGMGYAALGAFSGPFLGVSLSLVAVQRTQTGVATTLMATVPVMILPVLIVFRLERVSVRAAFGAALAVGGVALLWLR